VEETTVHIVRLCKAFVAIGFFGFVALAEQAMASPDEHLVPGPGPLPYGSHAESSISNPIEVDTYSFSGVAGDRIRPVLSSVNGFFDSHIVIRNSGGVIVDEASCVAGTVGCSTFLSLVLPTTCAYTISVSDADQQHTGNYSLYLDRYPPTSNVRQLDFPTGIQNIVVQNSLDYLSDNDYFSFFIAAGKRFNVTFATHTGFIDAHLEWWRPNGTLITDQSCVAGTQGCIVSFDHLATVSGFYRVGLSEADFSGTGVYSLGLNCLSAGGCGLVPEPSSYALMLAGLGLAASLSQRRAKITTS